jgi:SRSO17 transposase
MAVLARVDGIEASWLASGLDDAFALVAGRFFRREVRVRARACLAGMLSGLERKTGWSLAEYVGEKSPDGMQRLFTAARWDQDAVRDDVRGYVASALGDLDGVLIGDDTGFEKKGVCSAGVQRQYTGTAGKITNCQLGVFLAYAGRKGGRWSTGSFTCPGPGPGTKSDWRRRRSRPRRRSGQSRSSCG